MSVEDSESRRFESKIGQSFSQADRPRICFFRAFPKVGIFFLRGPYEACSETFWRVSLKSKHIIETSLSHWHRSYGQYIFLKRKKNKSTFLGTRVDFVRPGLTYSMLSHTSWTITKGIRGAAGARQPAAVKPLLNISYNWYVFQFLSRCCHGYLAIAWCENNTTETITTTYVPQLVRYRPMTKKSPFYPEKKRLKSWAARTRL